MSPERAIANAIEGMTRRTLKRSLPDSGGFRPIIVDDNEYELICMALRSFERKTAKDLRRSREKGFTPPPGSINVSEVCNRGLVALMGRLGITIKRSR